METKCTLPNDVGIPKNGPQRNCWSSGGVSYLSSPMFMLLLPERQYVTDAIKHRYEVETVRRLQNKLASQ